VLFSLRDNKTTKKLPFLLDKTHKNMIEMCSSSLALALSCVMAGSGDVDCLRILRELRWKVEEVLYGTHLALNMAIGMLFLGGGKYSLKRDPVATACLLLSVLPRFPSRTVDHQFHLQALRHFYVLAVESRALHTVDIDTGLPISVDLELELIHQKEKIIAKVPGLLPQLNTVKSISIVNSHNHDLAKDITQYYPCHMELANSNQRRTLPTFYVKQLPRFKITSQQQQQVITQGKHSNELFLTKEKDIFNSLLSHFLRHSKFNEAKMETEIVEEDKEFNETLSDLMFRTDDLREIFFLSLNYQF
jgi:hypothetical protein